jgi:hypothetical protein
MTKDEELIEQVEWKLDAVKRPAWISKYREAYVSGIHCIVVDTQTEKRRNEVLVRYSPSTGLQDEWLHYDKLQSNGDHDREMAHVKHQIRTDSEKK